MKAEKKTHRRRSGQSSIKRSKRHANPRPKQLPITWQNRLKSSWPLLLLLLFVVLFFTLFRTRQVDGESMQPTLTNGDRLLVRRTESFQRYDMITFEPTDRETESYVKRIIGMPGDSLQMEGNRMYLYEGSMKPTTAAVVSESVDVARLPDGTLMVTLSEAAATALSQLKAIPEGQYFVLGDNRNNSRDSRELGLINEDQIEGRVIFRYFPLNKIGRVS